MLLMGDEGTSHTRVGTTIPIAWITRRVGSTGILNQSQCRTLGRFVAKSGSCYEFGIRSLKSSGARLTLEQYQVEGALRVARDRARQSRTGKMIAHAIAFTLHTASLKRLLYVAVNAFWEPLSFELPASNAVSGSLGWQRVSWTHRSRAPDDIADLDGGVVITDARYIVNARSLVVLESILT
jgi:hypothetical protein